MALEQPVSVEPCHEIEQCLPEFLDGDEGPYPQQLLLRRPNKVQARHDAQEPGRRLERMAHALRVMVLLQDRVSSMP